MQEEEQCRKERKKNESRNKKDLTDPSSNIVKI
jgi:hypothetical protein